jgi:hypothetical protein
VRIIFFIALLLAAIGVIGSIFIKNQRSFSLAEREWQRGVEEKSEPLKSGAVNRALNILLQISPKSAAVNAALGRVLTQFQEYPLALYYYQQALRQDPKNPEIARLIQELVQATDLPPPPLVPDRESLSYSFLAFCILGSVILFSLWINNPRWEFLLGALLLALIPLIQWLLYFISPIQAMLIQSAPLHQEAHTQAPIIYMEPAGSTVVVLDALQKGEWVKILTPEGSFGYTQGKWIRILH